MTTELAERRKGQALSLLLLAVALIAIAAVTVGIEMRASRPDLASGPVVPGLHQSIAGGQRIVIASRDASYRIERTQRGDQSIWVMRDRGDYPVSSARLAALTAGLERLQFTRRMTTDPAKFDRLGVGDPRQGGNGVLVQIEDAHGARLVNLILGMTPAGGPRVVYVRRPDQNQTWAAEGDLPPLRDVAAWLDLHPLAVPAEQLTRVEVTPAAGRPFAIERDAATTAWQLASPAGAPALPSRVAVTAEAITHLSPVDVQPAPAIQGVAQARLRVLTQAGVAVEAELIPSEGRLWLKVVARALTAGDAPQEAAALAINDHASAWAFALSPEEAEALAPTLAGLSPAPPAPPVPTMPQPEAPAP